MICDTAYGLVMGLRRAEYLADRQAYWTAALSKDATDAEYPSWEASQAELDKELAAETTSPELRLLRELGVA